MTDNAALEIERRRQLYGRQRTDVEIAREIATATSALSTTTAGWLTFLPRPAAIETAQHAATGLVRLLGELAVLASAEAKPPR